MQIISAMCTIANRGKMVTPQIISSISDASGAVLASYPPVEVRQVVPPEVAEPLVSALKEVVSKRGTAPLAHVPGFEVAGKTGTAQKTSPGGGYEHGKYVVSFAGFSPQISRSCAHWSSWMSRFQGAPLIMEGTLRGRCFRKFRSVQHDTLIWCRSPNF